MINGQSAGKDFAYLLGTYFGDASVVKRTENCYTFSIEAIDHDFLERVSRELKSFTGKQVNIFERNRITGKGNVIYGLTCSKKRLFEQFILDTGNKKFVPDYVFSWSIENKVAFIEGVMDSDGWISARKNPAGITQFQMGYGTSFSWTYDIKRIMESIGMSCSKTREYKLKSGKTMLTFTIGTKSFVTSLVSFTSRRKQSRVEEYEKLKMQNKPQRLYAVTEKV